MGGGPFQVFEILIVLHLTLVILLFFM